MNTTKILSEALLASPDDFTLAGALRDHLFGDVGLVYSEAERKVDSIIQIGRWQRDLPVAAALMAELRPSAEFLLGLLRTSSMMVPFTLPKEMILVPGEHMPEKCTQLGDSFNCYPTDWTLIIPATWFINYVRVHRAAFDRHKRESGRK